MDLREDAEVVLFSMFMTESVMLTALPIARVC